MEVHVSGGSIYVELLGTVYLDFNNMFNVFLLFTN